MAVGCLIGTPSAIINSLATMSWAVGTANASYPVTNAKDLDPGVVAKANETTATLRGTFGVAQELVAVILLNVNNPGATVSLTNNGGLTQQDETIPSPEDSVSRNVWFDLRGLSGRSATQWNVVWSGVTAAVAIGSVVYVTEWIEPHIRWAYAGGERHPVIEHLTDGDKRLIYGKGVRVGKWRGVAGWYEDRALVKQLRREAFGPLNPWILIPDESNGEPMLVQFTTEDQEEEYEFHDGTQGVVQLPLEATEVNPGIAL